MTKLVGLVGLAWTYPLKYSVCLLLQEDNAGNLANGSQDALPCTAGFMGNPMMNMGSVSMK